MVVDSSSFVNSHLFGWRQCRVKLASWVFRHLVVREDTYGHYRPAPARAFKVLTPGTVADHFAGKQTIGLYTTEPGGDTAKWCCVEIDNHGDRDPAQTAAVAVKIYDHLRSLGFSPLFEDSNGRGGFHLWLIFNAPLPAKTLRSFGLWLVKDAPFPIEVFPKQDRVSTSKAKCGNFVRLPGKHHKRDFWSRIWDGGKWAAGEAAAVAILRHEPHNAALIPSEAITFNPPPPERTPSPDAPHAHASTDPERWMADYDGDLRTLDLVGLFEENNLYGQDLGGGQHEVTCPWHESHTTGHTGTCIWVTEGKYPGFNCMHAHCSGGMVNGKTLPRRGLADVCAFFGKVAVDDFCEKDYSPDDVSYLYEGVPPSQPKSETMNEPANSRSDYQFSPISFADFDKAVYKLEWLIEHFMVAGQPCIAGGPKKVLKTNLLVDLTISLGSGVPFLGKFKVPRRRRTVLISGESGNAVLQETARRVCKAKGIKMSDVDGSLDFRLPKLSKGVELAALAVGLSKMKAEVVILDPLYLCLLAGVPEKSAANLYDMGPILCDVARACLNAGATPILVHHSRKNIANPKEPLELEDLAFAGVQEFARQWLLLSRRAKYSPGSGFHQLWVSVGGSAGHNGLWGLDVNEGSLTSDFGGRIWDVNVLSVKEATIEKQKATEANREMDKHEKDQHSIDELLPVVRDTSERGKNSTNQVVVHLGWDRRKYHRVLSMAEQDGLIRIGDDKMVTLTSNGRDRIRRKAER